MRKRLGIFLAGLMALLLITGVWAYFNATNTISNPLQTQGYGVETREQFTPEDDWQPGMKVDKIVGVKNTGDYPLLVRVKFDEKWVGSQTNMTLAYNSAQLFPASAATGNQVNPTDGITASDGSVVFKNIPNIGTTGDTWTKGTDGYYYYNQVLPKGVSTASLLDAITLCLNTDMGVISTQSYYTTAGVQPLDANIGTLPGHASTQWVPYTSTDPVPDGATFTRAVSGIGANNGYSSADYTLNITTEVIQATKEARIDAIATSPILGGVVWSSTHTPLIP